MKVKYVAQKHEFGCAVACMALITGLPYDEIAARFEVNLATMGIVTAATRGFICDHGFAAIETRTLGYSDIRESNRRMQRPFADIHLVSVQPCADSETNHALVMDKDGHIFDPAHPEKKEFDYYFIHSVLGFFDERARESRRRARKKVTER